MVYRSHLLKLAEQEAQHIAAAYAKAKDGADILDVAVACQLGLEAAGYTIIGLDRFMHSENPHARPQVWTDDVYLQRNEGLVLLTRTMNAPFGDEPSMALHYLPYEPALITTIRRNLDAGILKRKEGYHIRREMTLRSVGTMEENFVRALLGGGRA